MGGREREFLVGAKNETASSEDASLLLSHTQDATMNVDIELNKLLSYSTHSVTQAVCLGLFPIKWQNQTSSGAAKS